METEKRIKKITIKNGWYWTAGRKYNWSDAFSCIGVGLNRTLFDSSDEIHITVCEKNGTKSKYMLDTKAGLEFIRKYKAHRKIGNALIGFVPKSILSPIEIELPQVVVECRHDFVEDEMFASGAIKMISGTPNCLGEETKLVCKKCGDEKYVPKNFTEQTSLLDLLK